jgi:hypothetical protein
MECQDRLKPSEGRGLRVTWTYRIGQDLFSSGNIGGGGERRMIAPHTLAGVAMVTRGGRGRGRVKWKVPDHHVVAAHWPNGEYCMIWRI